MLNQTTNIQRNPDLPAKIEMIIAAREKDLGGFTVRRILPYVSRRMVGPFIFFDHMGPAEFTPGEGMDVRPHPHINLATVTYLFEGKITHRDTLGSLQDIEPGAVNLMTAGRGIVHSERTPEVERQMGSRLNGIQVWIALPERDEEIEPSFWHYSKESLPEFNYADGKVKLLLGSAFGYKSPAQVHSSMIYAEVSLMRGGRFTIPAEGQESAIYVVEGKVCADGQEVNPTEMAIAANGEDLQIEATENSRFMVIGGEPLGERFIYWNFVSSSKSRIEEAKSLWSQGPSEANPRFQPIPSDNQEYIPLPNKPQPKGTIM
ncbi:MAG: pirin family protein [Bdellovibrionales bacterium]